MLKPLHDNVVLQSQTPQKTTKSGIILTGGEESSPNTAKVIAVGPGTKDKPVTLKEGDTVVYKSFASTDVEIGGEKYLIVSEENIIAVLEVEDNE